MKGKTLKSFHQEGKRSEKKQKKHITNWNGIDDVH